MRPVRVVPAAPKRQFARKLGPPERHEHQPSRELSLERPHQALDDRDAAVLADGAKAMTNPVTLTPVRKTAVDELRASVRDEMSRRSTGGADGAVEENLDRFRGGLLLEYGYAHDTAREVILDDGDEPAERPERRDGVRKPGTQKPRLVGTVVRSACQT